MRMRSAIAVALLPCGAAAAGEVPGADSSSAWGLFLAEVFRSIDTVGFVLIVLFIVLLGMVIDMFLHLRVGRMLPETLLADVQEEMTNGEYEKAFELSDKSPSLIGQVFAAILAKTDYSFDRMEEAMRSEVRIQGLVLRQWVAQFRMTAVLGILLGVAGAIVEAMRLVFDLARRPDAADVWTFETRALAYAAVCIAASFVLSFIKFEMPFGGSITLASFVPIIIYSYVFGFRRGLLAGVVYGLLQFIQSPFFVNAIQFFLDYIFAFSAIALAPVFKKVLNEKPAVILGMLAVALFRLAMHTCAGIIFFNEGLVYENLPQNNAFVYSLVYNAIYVAPDIAISIAAMCALLFTGSFKRIKVLIESNARINSEEITAAETEDTTE